ncbi:MAG: hypothetical protein EXQ74_06500 [Thermoleophilia bacterium]|nr:hypothetical protein [Thermoleophilia bacterium]
MAPVKKKKQAKRAGGRRANYAPLAHTVGTRKYFPYGWIMWTGWIMFGILTVAMFAEIFFQVADGLWVDTVGAVLMTALFGWMFWLFATSRLKDI